MIEVNLFTIPAGDQNARAGRCIARSRFNKELLGTTVEEFVKEFLKDNLDKLSGGISSELTDVLNSTSTFSRKDMACVNYYLIRSGYLFTIFNVTDDEENAEGVPSGDLVEWNIIDKNFIQQDYPTCTKIIPSPDQDIVYVLETVGKQSGLFEDSKPTIQNVEPKKVIPDKKPEIINVDEETTEEEKPSLKELATELVENKSTTKNSNNKKTKRNENQKN